MSDTINVFIIGITGYIGGAIAVALKSKYPTYDYVAFTRSDKSAHSIAQLGIKPLIGSSNEEENLKIIAEASAEADVVINAAHADHLPMTNIILDALKNSSKKLPILIHTSGTGVVTDKPTGDFQKETATKIWDDNNVEDIRSIDEKQPHRNGDLAIFNAGKGYHFIGYILAPSTIYGTAYGNPGNPLSQQVPDLIRTAVKKRQAVYAGSGTNIWNNVHIEDLTDLYVILFEKALAEQKAGKPESSDPYTRFYWGSAGEHVWGEVAQAIAPILFEKGVVDSDKAKSAPPSELPPATTTNSRTVSNRGFKDGWKPSKPSLKETLKEDVEAVLDDSK